MDKNALTAIVLSVLVVILWEWVRPRYDPPHPPPEQTKMEKERIPVPTPIRKLTDPIEKILPTGIQRTAKDIKVETDYYTAIFSSRGARLKHFLLKQYRRSVDELSPPIEMIFSTPGLPYPLGVQIHDPVSFNDKDLIYDIKGYSLRLSGNAKGTLTFQGQTPQGTTLIKKFTFTGSSYVIDLEVSAGASDGSSPPSLLLSTGGKNQNLSRDTVFEGLLALVDGKMIREIGEELSEEKILSGHVSWVGFGYTYFLFALLPDGDAIQTVRVKQAGSGVRLDIGEQAGTDVGGKARYSIFIGPKDLNFMKTVGKGLEQSIDLGWFGFVATPVLQLLRFSHRFTGSYGLDIILMTILIKLILAPLTHKSFSSMKAMQTLQPQMQRIKDKFKGEKEKMNKEIMELYRRNKVNPLGGCLPMLFQFPVFIGLYNALIAPIELRHTPFLWINDLSRPDWESLPMTLLGWNVGIPILVLFMGASMFLQQWMTPTAGDPNQKRLMYMMPVIFTVMFVNFPSGLTIYWLVNNILTIGQQYIINRMTK